MTGEFDLKLIKNDKEELVKVVLQEINPFVLANIVSANRSVKTGAPLVGDALKDYLENNLIVRPKNILKQIEESDNAIEAMFNLYNECDSFCSSPKRYRILQEESRTKSESVESDNSKPDTDRNKKHVNWWILHNDGGTWFNWRVKKYT